MNFYKEIGEIYRLKVPFDGEVYTSVFLIKHSDGHILVDCATTAEDVEGWIIPALEAVGMPLKEIRYLVLTHQHSDHAGGRRCILQVNPDIEVIENAQAKLPNGYTMYEMKGHTMDCVGVFDLDTHTLITGDGLQGYGVEKYRAWRRRKTV